MKTLTNSDVSDVMFFKQYFCNFLNASSVNFFSPIFMKLCIQMYFTWFQIIPEVSLLNFILNFQKLRKSNLKRAVFQTVHFYGPVFSNFWAILYFITFAIIKFAYHTTDTNQILYCM